MDNALSHALSQSVSDYDKLVQCFLFALAYKTTCRNKPTCFQGTKEPRNQGQEAKNRLQQANLAKGQEQQLTQAFCQRHFTKLGGHTG
jgi:hypothetical protein